MPPSPRRRPLQRVLLDFAKPTALSAYGSPSLPQHEWYKYAHLAVANEYATHLAPFLTANMDEIRLFHAENYAVALLRRADHDDVMHFRRGVLRREMSKDMDYDRQRDHAAHTLYNYLLGWYLTCQSGVLSSALRTHFVRRMMPPSGVYRDWEFIHDFFGLWSFASLLHDIGYLFEGGLLSMDTAAAATKASRGAEYAAEFFQCIFWEQLRLSPDPLRAWMATHAHGRRSPVRDHARGVRWEWASDRPAEGNRRGRVVEVGCR
jgi:hypothetical protein